MANPLLEKAQIVLKRARVAFALLVAPLHHAQLVLAVIGHVDEHKALVQALLHVHVERVVVHVEFGLVREADGYRVVRQVLEVADVLDHVLTLDFTTATNTAAMPISA